MSEPIESVFTPPGDVLLQRCASAILSDQIQSKETQEIIEKLFAVKKGERDGVEQCVMVGLAAPQIGISKRIILVDMGVDSDRKELGELKAFINPEITWSSTEMVEGREGCYSVDERVVGVVSRAEKIRLKAWSPEGKKIDVEYSGMTARIFQHEVDHLDGIRFPDRITSEDKLHWVEKNERLEHRQQLETWSHKCPHSVWEAMKKGKPFSPPK